MDWFKRHIDAIFVLSGIIASMLWMNGQFNEVNRHMDSILRSEKAVIDAIRQDNIDFRKDWMAESKDFHNRLYAIKERNRK